MLIVRNTGLCNLRVCVSTAERYLIIAGNTQVELPDSVRDIQFFKELVNDGTVVIDKDEPDESNKKPKKSKATTTEAE